jgi:hypothetical protein
LSSFHKVLNPMSTICHPGLPFPLVSKPSICHTKCEGLNLRECCTSIVDVLYAKGKRMTFSSFSIFQFHLISRRGILQQEKNGSRKTLLHAALTFPIARSCSNPVAWLKPSHSRNHVLPSPPPPHLPSSLIRLRILMQRWTRFWLLICRTSHEYTDDHHSSTSPSRQSLI